MAWFSFFGAGRSFRFYAAHLEQARLLIGVSTTWKSKAVLTAGYGLANAGDRLRNPCTAVPKDQLLRLVSTNGWHNELSALAQLSWTFLRRAPSECLPLYRQRAGEELSSDDRFERRRPSGYRQES